MTLENAPGSFCRSGGSGRNEMLQAASEGAGKLGGYTSHDKVPQAVRSGRSGNGMDPDTAGRNATIPGCRAGRHPERSGWKRKRGLCGYRAPDFAGGGISTVVKRKDVRARSRDAENRQAETGRFAAVVRSAQTLRSRIVDAETRGCDSRIGERSIHAGVNNSAKVVRKFVNRNFPNGKDRKTVEIHPHSERWKGCGQIGWEGSGRPGPAAWDETV